MFRRDRTDITVSIPAGQQSGDRVRLSVPRQIVETAVRPNPLFLVVSVAEDGKVSLNHEPFGTIADPRPLMDKLRQVFKDRETNGVFRQGTNEVVKSVTIVMSMDNNVSDLARIARALSSTGAGPLDLLDFLENDRKEILPAPTIPPRKRP